MFLTTFSVGAKRHRPVPRRSCGRGEHRLGGCSPQISGGPRRKDAAAKTIASTAHGISTAQLCLWDGCTQLMLCSGSCGTESKSWGMSSVLCSAPLTTAPPPRQNPQPAKCPCCPARLRKCKKIKQPPPTSHHIRQTPIPQNGRIMLPAQSSARPVSANNPFFAFVLFCLPVSANNAFAFFPIPRACHQHMQK
jgi:hypothetical protein